MSSIYLDNGFTDRNAYLQSLVDSGHDEVEVMSLADALGPSEDFDGLVSALEDTY